MTTRSGTAKVQNSRTRKNVKMTGGKGAAGETVTDESRIHVVPNHDAKQLHTENATKAPELVTKAPEPVTAAPAKASEPVKTVNTPEPGTAAPAKLEPVAAAPAKAPEPVKTVNAPEPGAKAPEPVKTVNAPEPGAKAPELVTAAPAKALEPGTGEPVTASTSVPASEEPGITTEPVAGEPVSASEPAPTSNCPNLSVDVNAIPTCMTKKTYNDLSMKVHPDKNMSCDPENLNLATEKMQALTKKKEAQTQKYGDLSEESFNKCNTDNPTTDNPTTDNPTTDNPTTDNPTTDNPTTDNPTTDPTTIDNNATDPTTDTTTTIDNNATTDTTATTDPKCMIYPSVFSSADPTCYVPEPIPQLSQLVKAAITAPLAETGAELVQNILYATGNKALIEAAKAQVLTPEDLTRLNKVGDDPQVAAELDKLNNNLTSGATEFINNAANNVSKPAEEALAKVATGLSTAGLTAVSDIPGFGIVLSAGSLVGTALDTAQNVAKIGEQLEADAAPLTQAMGEVGGLTTAMNNAEANASNAVAGAEGAASSAAAGAESAASSAAASGVAGATDAASSATDAASSGVASGVAKTEGEGKETKGEEGKESKGEEGKETKGEEGAKPKAEEGAKPKVEEGAKPKVEEEAKKKGGGSRKRRHIHKLSRRIERTLRRVQKKYGLKDKNDFLRRTLRRGTYVPPQTPHKGHKGL